MNPQALPSIYVGDLQYDVTDNMLFEMFKRVGTIQSIRICRDRTSNKSLGYAYVNFLTIEEAQRAIDTFNNTDIKGRPCRIMFSNRDPSARKSGLGNIFIANLDSSIASKELYDTFSQFGDITSCKVVPRFSGKSVGYVHFKNIENAEKAISIVHGKKLGENIVYVTKFIPRHERQRYIEKIWTNLFIKNIPSTIDSDDQLRDLFSSFGETTSCRVMKDLTNNTPLGFGYVCFKRHEDAVKAVAAMNQKEINGVTIECSRYKTKGERLIESRKFKDNLKKTRKSQYLGKNLYIKNLEDNVTDDLLKKEFEAYGNVTSVRVERTESGISKGFGYVCFSTKEEAQNAIQQCGKTKILEGCTKPLYVNLHEPKEDRIQRIISRPKKPVSYPFHGAPMYMGMPYVGYNPNYGTQRINKQVDPARQGGQQGGRGSNRNYQGNNLQPRKPKLMTDYERTGHGNNIFGKLKSMGLQEDDNFLGSFVGAVITLPDFTAATAEKYLNDDKYILSAFESYKEQITQSN